MDKYQQSRDTSRYVSMEIKMLEFSFYLHWMKIKKTFFLLDVIMHDEIFILSAGGIKTIYLWR